MACRIVSARRYTADCAAHGRFDIDEYQQSPLCPGLEGVVSPQLRQRFERVVAENAARHLGNLSQRLEVGRAEHANLYVTPRSRPAAAWRWMTPERVLLVLAVIVAVLTWAARRWGF